MTPEQILAKAKSARKPLPRWVWISAIAIGVACAVAFLWILVAPAGTPTTPPQHEAGSPGFATGAIIGAAVGILVGWAFAQRNSSRNNP